MTPSTATYELVVFDWDGTLLDSIGAIVDCTLETMERLELGTVDEARIRDGIGMDLRETVVHLVPGADDALFDRICRVYRELWAANFADQPILFDGVRSTLEELVGSGHRLAIATAKPRDGLNPDLARSGVAHLFSATRTMDDAPGKPHPKMVHDILDELSVGRERALVVGDSVHDMRMAVNAGVDAVGVTSGTHGAEALAAAGASQCLPSATELPAWLGLSRAATAAAASLERR